MHASSNYEIVVVIGLVSASKANSNWTFPSFKTDKLQPRAKSQTNFMYICMYAGLSSKEFQLLMIPFPSQPILWQPIHTINVNIFCSVDNLSLGVKHILENKLLTDWYTNTRTVTRMLLSCFFYIRFDECNGLNLAKIVQLRCFSPADDVMITW